MQQDAPSDMSCAEFGRFLARYGAAMSRQAVSKSQVIPKLVVGGRPRVPVAEALTALHAAGRISLAEPVTVDPGPLAGPMAMELPLDEADTRPTQGRPKAGGSGGGTYYDEKAQTERIIREIKEIELAQLRGELVRTADVTEALTNAGRKIGEHLDRMASYAGEIAASAREGGEAAVRDWMRQRARVLRETMGDALAQALVGGGGDDEPA